MKSIKPIALKEAKVLNNEEMKHLFGGSSTTITCTFTCKGGATMTASGCTQCSAADNGGYCIYSDGSASLIMCATNNDDSGTSGKTDDGGFIQA